ncbi:MAG TPA: carboxypeptidase regulatory-like domain-containing protein [Thermoanaerobaculia bacterium]|nr:carboxypeptidase regulatory-like domain-containing protein [Thermoanaerobaculia bacterium]
MEARTTWRRSLAALTLGTLLVWTAACGGGGEESPEPAGDGAAAPAADAGGNAAENIEPGNPHVADLGTGNATVRGTVTFAGSPPPPRPVQMDPECTAKNDEQVMQPLLVLGEGQTVGNIFVKVSSGLPDQQYTAPSQPAVMDQEGCMYHPHVMGVMQGQTLRFLNSDELMHNVHGQPRQNREFNQGMPASVEVSDVTHLNTPEPLFPVKCDAHPWMQSYVAVMEHPYFDVTEEDGQFTLANLPAGTYEIEAWHERLGTQTQTVTVEDGGSATVDFTFSVPQA